MCKQSSAENIACTITASHFPVSKVLRAPVELKVLFKCKLLFTISYASYKFVGSFISTLVCSSKSFHSHDLYAKILRPITRFPICFDEV